jgi:hypothetical protein
MASKPRVKGHGFSVVLQGVENIKAKVEREVIAPVTKATKFTIKDMRRDVPRLVGKRVAERYNIKATECQPPEHKVTVSKKTGQKKSVRRATAVKTSGETLETLSWVWTGRRLTAQRFSMKPGGIPSNKARYDISFTVLRGKEERLESDEGRIYFINDLRGVRQAMSRKTDGRKIDRVEKTTSIPVMIDNENLQPLIQRDINERLEDRLNKNIAKFAR